MPRSRRQRQLRRYAAPAITERRPKASRPAILQLQQTALVATPMAAPDAPTVLPSWGRGRRHIRRRTATPAAVSLATMGQLPPGLPPILRTFPSGASIAG